MAAGHKAAAVRQFQRNAQHSARKALFLYNGGNAAALGGKVHLFAAQGQRNGLAGAELGLPGPGAHGAARHPGGNKAALGGHHGALQDVGAAHKPGHKAGAGFVVHLGRGADLHKLAVPHHGDAVGHGERLFLVVGDVDEGNAQLLLQGLQLQLHLAAQLKVQRAEGLVQQKHPGPVHHRPGNGHPLLLPAGKLAGHPVFIPGQLHQFQRLSYGPGNLLFGAAAKLQAVPDVGGHRHVGKQGVILEYGVHVPLVRRGVGHIPAFQQHPTCIGAFQPGNDAQRGGFSTAGRAEQRDEFPGGRVQRNAPQNGGAVKGFFNVLQLQNGLAHAFSFTCKRPGARNARQGMV